ncbi:MAG: hypothetical protein HYU02_05515 [Thaumarchaeota archaeon]|nr:hypothetical protein [Nitrososphaerota archaeon]
MSGLIEKIRDTAGVVRGDSKAVAGVAADIAQLAVQIGYDIKAHHPERQLYSLVSNATQGARQYVSNSLHSFPCAAQGAGHRIGDSVQQFLIPFFQGVFRAAYMPFLARIAFTKQYHHELAHYELVTSVGIGSPLYYQSLSRSTGWAAGNCLYLLPIILMSTDQILLAGGIAVITNAADYLIHTYMRANPITSPRGG